jgi:hypothetical protein
MMQNARAFVLEPKTRHPRESGDLVDVTDARMATNAGALFCKAGGYWVPAFAGMTVGGSEAGVHLRIPMVAGSAAGIRG